MVVYILRSKVIQRSNSKTWVVESVFPGDHNMEVTNLESNVIQRSKSEFWLVESDFPWGLNEGHHSEVKGHPRGQILKLGRWDQFSQRNMMEVSILKSKIIQRSNSETWVMELVFPGIILNKRSACLGQRSSIVSNLDAWISFTWKQDEGRHFGVKGHLEIKF